MGKRLKDNQERIVQRSIGFTFRHMLFFNEHPDFKPDTFCREAIDEQIKQIDQRFLKK
jgi:hypothetical protein